jgi:hypothetical protein
MDRGGFKVRAETLAPVSAKPATPPAKKVLRSTSYLKGLNKVPSKAKDCNPQLQNGLDSKCRQCLLWF